MGFGLLFFGYASAYIMSLNSFGFMFRLVGSFIMMLGISKLSDFEKKFNLANIFIYLLALAAMAESIFAVLPEGFAPQNSAYYCQIAFWVLSVPYHVFLYLAVAHISKEVGVLNIFKRSVQYGVFGIIALALVPVTLICWYFKAPFAEYLAMAAFILPYVLFVLNLSLFYSCYKNICEEGDEDAPRKPSKIPFLNKLFEASEKREQEIYEKTKSYAENKIKQDNEKKKNKNKKKKKK